MVPTSQVDLSNTRNDPELLALRQKMLGDDPI